MDGHAELRSALARLALFADFDESNFERLLASAREVRFHEGAWVVRRGDVDVGLHVIVDGEAGVVYRDDELAVLPRGSFFGEISVLLGEPVVADIVARSPLRCLVLSAADLEKLLLELPQLTLRMLKTEARRLKTMDEARA